MSGPSDHPPPAALETLRQAGFDIAVRNHAGAILAHDFPDELAELIQTLSAHRIPVSELIGGGGGESGQTQRLRHALAEIGWAKHSFTTRTIVDGIERDAISHEVDHVRFAANGTIALEIEWNNKDPFFDRDLENFQRLHAISAISLGVIVTRGSSMQDALLPSISRWLDDQNLLGPEDIDRLNIPPRTRAQTDDIARHAARGMPYAQAFAANFTASKFGPSTTHWAKLDDRIRRGVGNPCPLLLIGLPDALITDRADPEPEPRDLFS